MTADEFVQLVGSRIVHITLNENLAGIAAHGLLRPNTLARLAGVEACKLVLRAERMQLRVGQHTARLNNQGKLLLGRKRAAQFLDGHTMESWSAQLDGRVFFWSERASEAFERSHGQRATAKSEFDARKVFQALRPYLDLAPINSGSAERNPARRGDWIYVSADRSKDEFRLNRLKRGLVKAPDSAREISVRADIDANLLESLRV